MERDWEILALAVQSGCAVVTLDADFHALLAKSGSEAPSVIRIRIEGLRAEGLARLPVDVLEVYDQDLTRGAMVSVTESAVRIRRLPLMRGSGTPGIVMTWRSLIRSFRDGRDVIQ